jgi:hypothetical protein
MLCVRMYRSNFEVSVFIELRVYTLVWQQCFGSKSRLSSIRQSVLEVMAFPKMIVAWI